jgi:DNA polymerase II large subunit
MNLQASQAMHQYFTSIHERTLNVHDLATRARAKGYDPDTEVEVKLAANMAERVVGLISVLTPQIVGSGVVERIIALEQQYGNLDWRVAITIACELAQQKFCAFKDQKEAMEIGIRVGLAYITLGTVSSPLDGFVNLNLKQRMDGKGQYASVNFAGPIRNAGGTAAAVVLLLADAVRKLFGYADYDAQEIEIKRTYTEMIDYRERVAPRQYFPTPEEVEFLMKHLPVEVAGEPSEKFEVSNYKDLPRVPTNLVRSGFCLMMTECIPLKAPKLWRQLSVWGKDFGLENWSFLEEYLKIQKKAKSQGEAKQVTSTTAKIMPDYSYLHDLVAGRPIFSHPLRTGGFRLRYGRSRTSGLSSCAVHPATMVVSTDYIATGTQFRHERPSKGTAVTACDTIEGPIVKLMNGAVLQLTSLAQAKSVVQDIREILYFGDLLIPYGDFFNRAHPLVPAGYCPEWWALELERAIITKFGSLDLARASEHARVSLERIKQLLDAPLTTTPRAQEALSLTTLGAPLHPTYTYYWSTLAPEQLLQLLGWLGRAKTYMTEQGVEKIVFPHDDQAKRVLELLGVPHAVVTDNQVIVEQDHAQALHATLKDLTRVPEQPVLDTLNAASGFVVRDRAGTFIGARMGRPEKAKMRKLTGSPHCLFPVGEEGGKFRSFQSAVEQGKITAEFARYRCLQCSRETVLPRCEVCDVPAKRVWFCRSCNLWLFEQRCTQHGETQAHTKIALDAKHYFNRALEKLGVHTYPELIKGVKGTSNQEHLPEHLAKGVLRAKHEVAVNKDGTTRYDITQLPITHFKPCEIGTPITRLKELGYVTDIHGKPLEYDDQVLELKPQDIILPDCDASPDEGASAVLIRSANFIDDELTSLYGLPQFYKIKTPDDLINHLVVALAPHTSAGVVCRIIGFSKTQGFFAHPYMHSATRRDCDGDEACVSLLMDTFLNFSRKYLPNSRGGTMDAPLVLTSILNPAEVDDMVLDVDVGWKYPLELYEAALQYKMPWEIKIRQIKSLLGKPEQYEGFGFTHDFKDLNETVRCSAYKTLPSMEEKLRGQMALAEKIRAVDASDVARLVIEKHFLKDTKGNLRKFGMQEFRCVNCNEKFRRPPLIGKCTHCNGKILFTITEGSIVKYLEPAISLANKYNADDYLKQSLELLQARIEGVFGKDKEKQLGLGAWFG